MSVRFLLDENISPRVRVAIQRHYPHIDILRVGDEGTPRLETLDPEILQHLELSQRILVTKNRASMPGTDENQRKNPLISESVVVMTKN